MLTDFVFYFFFLFHPTEYPAPVRLPNNNLHQYSKVLESYNKKRPLPQCQELRWKRPVYVAASVSKEQFFLGAGNGLGGRGDDNLENEDGANANNNILRKLESQKGEVRSS